MIRFLDRDYVPIEPDFLAPPSWMVAPRLIGCVLCMDYRGAEIAIALSDLEAYDQSEGACHCADTQRLEYGHAYVHEYTRSGMLALDLVCAPKGHASSVLVRAGIPLIGIEAMAVRRSVHPAADRRVRNRTKGYEKWLAYSPCTVGEALDVTPALNGAWLFEKPFRIYRPVDPVVDIVPDARVNVGKDADLPWRWTWRNPPSCAVAA